MCFVFIESSYGRGGGVGRGLGVNAGLGVGEGLGVEVGVAVVVAVAVAVGVAVGVAVAVAVGVALGVAVTVGVGLAGVAVAVAVGVGLGVPDCAQYFPPVFKTPKPFTSAPDDHLTASPNCRVRVSRTRAHWWCWWLSRCPCSDCISRQCSNGRCVPTPPQTIISLPVQTAVW